MKFLIGLGNPGDKFIHTRHNVGFMVIDLLSESHSISMYPGKGEFFIGESKEGDFALVKPTTFMNRSGVAVSQLREIYKFDPGDILVIHDDMDLPLGRLRLRPRGSDGGHKGISSIIFHLLSEDFPRMKIGIDSRYREAGDVDFVLSPFRRDERKIVKEIIETASSAARYFVQHGIEYAMNEFNGVNLTQNLED